MRRTVLLLLVTLIGVLSLSALLTYLLVGHGGSFGIGEGVAILEIHGTIGSSNDPGLLGEEGTTPQGFKELLKRAEGDRSVRAILIDINSPGGSVVASEEIAQAVKDAQKPTVAWLNEIAASGGYYVASSADYIVADRASITGSIGVISIFPEYSRLLEKLGVNMTVVKGGEYKDFSSGFRPMRPEEREMMENVTMELYDQFIGDVAANRNLSKDYVKQVAEGKIYTGPRAKELGLVDEVGSRDRALEEAARLGNITGEPEVVTYRRRAFLKEFVGVASVNFGYGMAKGLLEGTKPSY